ncbi:hypothetical protein CORC01_13647 [Colletotrichum orchidophilum]|uniref:BZIP domain-containing protein n=1 Tax=Colletotrichum orchidophilum TaxID=1209926 RepID=A0A1G4APG9_9PEZI|nr:uncharacterized protein CORC01_13647 [Colletotrichum orchidophilum]OHE91059.1 hypothetical protein CORC01_13647 [Colletotrichum orchidophilum]
MPVSQTEPRVHVLAPMLHSSEAQCRDDDWTGLRDQAERRKRQNRLNVRAYRKRKALESHQNEQTKTSIADGSPHKESWPGLCSERSLEFIHWVPPTQSPAEVSLFGGPHNCSETTSNRDGQRIDLPVTSKRDVMCVQTRLPPRHPNSGKSRLAKHVPPYFQNPTTWFPLYKDHLIPLIYYNVFRATITNIHILSLTSLLAGPCVPDIHTTPLFPPPCQVPDTLMPTPTQSSTPHETWIDIFPSGCMRDNAIKFRDQYSQHDLCSDLVGCQEGDVSLGQPGIIAWSDPWHPDGWEVTETFIEKWSFLLKGCEDVMRATNKWRSLRGEEPLVWELE